MSVEAHSGRSLTLLLKFSSPVQDRPFCGAGDIYRLNPQSIEVAIEDGAGVVLGSAEVVKIVPVSDTIHEATLALPLYPNGTETLAVTAHPSECYDARPPCGSIKGERIRVALECKTASHSLVCFRLMTPPFR